MVLTSQVLLPVVSILGGHCLCLVIVKPAERVAGLVYMGLKSQVLLSLDVSLRDGFGSLAVQDPLDQYEIHHSIHLRLQHTVADNWMAAEYLVYVSKPFCHPLEGIYGSSCLRIKVSSKLAVSKFFMLTYFELFYSLFVYVTAPCEQYQLILRPITITGQTPYYTPPP